MEKLGKRIVTGIMAGVLAVSLGLAPADTVRAEEILTEGAGEVITADDVIGEQEEEAGSELEDDGAGDLESKISGENESEERQENPEENMAGEETEDALQETVTGEQDDESDWEPTNEPVEVEKASEIAEGIDAVEQEGVLQVVETAEQAADIVSGTDWTLDADGKLTIRSDAGMKDWASRGKESYGAKIVSVEVQEGVTSIGDEAFYRCSGLNSITLPSSVINIGDNAFYECSSLKSITLPSGVTSIGRWAFAYSSLTGIGIPSSVTSIGSNAFRACSSLARVIMQGINPPALGSEAFTLCHFETNRAQGIKIPLGTAEVYKAAWSDWVDYIDCVAAGNGIDWTLDGDGQLTIRSNVGMEDWRAAGKEKHGKKLVSVKIQAGVTDIGDGAFQYCSNLTSIELPLSVTDIGDYAFQYCSRLTGIELPSKVTDIGDYAFQYCSRLTGVEFPSKVTSIGDYAFQYCSRLTDIELPASITGIGDGAFQYCSRLTDMTLPPDVASIGNRAFNGCSCLESVTMQGITPPTLDIVNSGTGKTYVFDSCKFVEDNVKGIKVPSGTADAYKTAWTEWADYITDGSESADGFLVSGTDWMLDVDGKLTIRSDKGMEGWQNIGKINHARQVISVEIAAGVTCIPGSSFAECENLKQILIPSGVKNIGDRAFLGCSLTSITIPSSVTSIGNQAFWGCTRLTSITIPSGVASIGELAFSGCGNLTSIILPSGVTSIEDGVFYNCSSLTSITIPSGVTGIGAYAFRGCSSLERVIMKGTTPPTLGVTKDDTDVAHVFQFCKFVKDKTKGIEVPVGTVEEYKTAWVELADYIADNREKVEVAKQAAEAALAEIQVSNATTKESFEAAMKDAVKAALEEAGIGSDGVDITVEDFISKGATIKVEGSVSGSVRITSGTESGIIPINKTIDKLPVTPAGKVAAAKVAVEDAVKNAIDRLLAGTGVTNDNAEETATKIKGLIPDAVAGALVEAGVSADEVAAGEAGIEVQLADADSEGSINITIPLTSKEDAGQSDCAAVRVQIAKPGGETEPDKDVQKMVEDAIKGITVTNETTKEDILAALKEELGDKATVEGIEKFEKQDATEETTGNISIGVSVTVNGKTVAVDTSVVIPKLNRSDRKTGVTVHFTDYYDLDGSTPCYKYTGVAVRPMVEVYNNTELLTPGTDYTVGYKNNTKVSSTAALMIKGKGNFSGTSDMVGFTIINADIEKDTDHPTEMTVVANTKVAPIIMNGTKKLTTKDYRLEGNGLANGKYAAATEEGSPNILIVKGIGSYAGSSFEIKVRVIEKSAARKLTVAVDRNFKPVYSGSTLNISSLIRKAQGGEGAITVTDAKDRTKILKEGTDFTVLCTSSLCNSGTVNFTVTGMGEYTGSVNRSFRISPLKVTDKSKFSVAFDEQKAYEYSPAGTTVDNLVVKYLGETDTNEDDKILIQGVDYKVTYNNHKKVSVTRDAGFKITFLGNYRGSSAVSRTFKIVTAKLSAANTEVTVPDKVYSKANRAYKATPIVTVDGVAIKASNYTVSYAWATGSEAGDDTKYISDNKVKITIADGDTWAKVRVTVTPKGNGCYSLDEGTVLEGIYYVRKINDATNLSRAKVTFFNKTGTQIKVLEYNGYPFYTPVGNNAEADNAPEDVNAVYVRVVVGGVVVDPELYEVIWTNATEKGKATVVIRGKGLDAGKGAAVGSKNQVISIKAMALKGKTLKFFMENTANMLESIF